MEWTELAYSPNQVKKAGKTLRNHARGEEVVRAKVVEASAILINFRSAHSYALNAAQNGLRSRIRTATGELSPSVTQRLKERPSIVNKLVRGYPKTQLSTLQDIAGVRGVVDTTEAVYRVVDQIRASGRGMVVGIDDYISRPQASGYRGVHVIMEYNDRPTGQARLVEVQLRSAIQHEWADGVESLAKRTGYSLKQGEGPDEVLEYLRTASKVLEAIEVNGEAPQTLVRQLDEQRDAAKAVLNSGGTSAP